MQRVWDFLGIHDPLARHVFFWGLFARIALTLIGDALDKIGSSSSLSTDDIKLSTDETRPADCRRGRRACAGCLRQKGGIVCKRRLAPFVHAQDRCTFLGGHACESAGISGARRLRKCLVALRIGWLAFCSLFPGL